MDIKREVKNLVVYAKCQEAAEAEGEDEAIDFHRQRMRRSFHDIYRWADMAEAALALAEYQATSGYDPSVDPKTYTAERGRLWDAFMAARAKVKTVDQQ